MPRILHTADLHLDAPFSLHDVQKAQIRKNEMRGTFASLILLAKTEKADVMILSGDLFDSGFVTKETATLMMTQFASVPTCRFIIAPGNHDAITSRSPYRKEVFPPNVYIFEEETVKRFSFEDIGVDVYGFAFTSEKFEKNPLAAPVLLDRRRINILAAHCDLTGKSAACPISPADLARSGFDYAALGHIHKGGAIERVGDTYYAYSGCPEGRSFDECGIKGVILADMTKAGGRLAASFTTQRICRRHYERLTVNVTGASSNAEVLDKVKASLQAVGYGADVLLRLKLEGRILPSFTVATDLLTAQTLGVFYLEVTDDTVPLLNMEALKNDISIRGAFFRELLPQLESEDEQTRETAARAFRYGLAALDGNDVIDF